MLYADPRRIGDHGIGRFARCVLAGLDYSPIPLKTDPDSPLDPWRLSRALGRLTRNDLFFSPGYNPPLACPAPFVFTVHDLNHLDRPENSSPLKRLYYALVVKRACHLSARVFTVSEFSRGRIIEWSGVSSEKVVNVRCGVGPEYHPEVVPYEMPFPYILCVSNRRKHKNEFRQLEAFAKSGLADDIHFVLTGDPTEELTNFVKHKQIAERVHFLGLIPDAQLPSLYRGAQALTFASLYEGFGLPVLEALACGTAVVTSNTSALPELAGDAALLVDPTSVEEISEAMARIVSDTTLRTQLREKGLAQAARFSWAATVAKVKQLLNSDEIRGAGKGR